MLIRLIRHIQTVCTSFPFVLGGGLLPQGGGNFTDSSSNGLQWFCWKRFISVAAAPSAVLPLRLRRRHMTENCLGGWLLFKGGATISELLPPIKYHRKHLKKSKLLFLKPDEFFRCVVGGQAEAGFAAGFEL